MPRLPPTTWYLLTEIAVRAGAVAWVLGFLAAVQLALLKLIY